MAQKINISGFLENLTSKTQKGSCNWEKMPSSDYRLLLKTGSIKFSATYSQEFDSYEFKLELYDMKKCFYTIYGSELMDARDNYYTALDSLYKAIVDRKNAELSTKISSLEQEILAL